jgi:hypothetical protein
MSKIYEDGNFLYARRLTFISLTDCNFCSNPVNAETHQVQIEHLRGWQCCGTKCCVDKLKHSLLKTIEIDNIFPLNSLVDADDGKISVEFYRKTKNKVQNGVIEHQNNNFGFLARLSNINLYTINVAFEENMRSVSLENIFHHNRKLYDQLIRSKDLFKFTNIDCKISFDELPISIKISIKKAYNDGISAEWDSFKI